MAGFRHIIAYLGDADSAPAASGLALLVARDFDAHVEMLHVRPDLVSAVPFFGVPSGIAQGMIEVAERAADERRDQLRRDFEQSCGRQNLVVRAEPTSTPEFCVSWREESGREEDVVARAGRLADLMVMARPESDRDTPSVETVNAALMGSGRPVLLAPPKLPERVGRRVAVFWNGSAEAARAVAQAMPFLTRAEKVFVLNAEEPDGETPEPLARSLAWHGIRAQNRSLSVGQGGEAVAKALLAEAEANQVDLAVMGAYTHSRLRELVLGGVTQHVLFGAGLPILLSH